MILRTTVNKVLLAIISPIVFFGILEITTRVLWRYEVEGNHVGIIVQGSNRQIRQNGIVYKTNSQGIRYRELEEIASSNKRIMALGDSFVWGDGLPEEALVTTKIEQMLQSQFPGILVINAGIPGHNTEDEYEQLVRLSPIYQPHHIFVFFFTNDVLAKKDHMAGRKAVVSWRQNLKEYLRKRSKFIAFFYYKYKTKYAAKFGVPKDLLPQDYFNLDDGKPGWLAFKQAVIKIRDYCADNNIGLQFVVIPTLTALNKNYPYAELQKKVTDFFAKSNIPFVDLFSVFASYEPADLWVSYENTHWNDVATSLAAKAIVRHFEKMKSIQ